MAVIDLKDRTKILNVFLDAQYKKLVEHYIMKQTWQDLDDTIVDNKALLPESLDELIAKMITEATTLATRKNIWDATTAQVGQVVAAMLPEASEEFIALSDETKDFVWMLVFDSVTLNFAQDLMNKREFRKAIGIR